MSAPRRVSWAALACSAVIGGCYLAGMIGWGRWSVNARSACAWLFASCVKRGLQSSHADRPAYAYAAAVLGLRPDGGRACRAVEGGGTGRHLPVGARLLLGRRSGSQALGEAQLPCP